MIIRTLDDVTADALAAMSSTEDPRLRDILASLVKNLHAFVRAVRLTEPKFRQAAAILNEMGKRSSDSHNDGRIARRVRWYACSTMAMAKIRRRRSHHSICERGSRSRESAMTRGACATLRREALRPGRTGRPRRALELPGT